MRLNADPEPVSADHDPILKGTVVEVQSAGDESSTLPKSVRPNSLWRYKHHALRWDWCEEFGWYPVLGRMHLTSGVEGIEVKKGQYVRRSLNHAKVANLGRGWTIIEYGDPRLGKYRNYLQKFPTVKGSPYHASIFVRPDVVGKLVEWTRDDGMYAEFLELLVTSGVVRPIAPVVKRGRIRRQQKVVDKLERDLFDNPNHPMLRTRYERESRKLAGMHGYDLDEAIQRARVVADEAVKHAAADTSTTPDEVAQQLDAAPPLECPVCGKTCKSEHGLNLHMERMHGPATEADHG